jgi:hypothetical protein
MSDAGEGSSTFTVFLFAAVAMTPFWPWLRFDDKITLSDKLRRRPRSSKHYTCCQTSHYACRRLLHRRQHLAVEWAGGLVGNFRDLHVG